MLKMEQALHAEGTRTKHIVESGTTDGWNWTKYDDGTCEAKGYWEESSCTWTIWNTNFGFITKRKTAPTCFSAIKFASANLYQAGTNTAIGASAIISGLSVDISLVKMTLASPTSCYYGAEIYGTWE